MESSPPNNNNTTTAGTGGSAAAWTEIVRAEGEITLPENPPDTGDNAGGGGGNKKPAWNKKPSNVPNGGAAGDNNTPPVVIGGAASWPALSESTKASPKPSPADSGSTAAPAVTVQVTGLAAPSSSTSPLSSPSQPSLTSQKPTTSNAAQYPAFSTNHGRPARQKSMKRGDGSSGGNMNVAQANGGFPHQPTTGEGLNANSHHNSSVKPSSSGGNDSAQNHGNRESGPRTGDHHHHQQRSNSFRRNGGPHSRGDGNYGGRRGGGDQDHGNNHEWNRSRSFNGRDANPPMHPRGGPRGGFVRAPPVSAPFVHPVAGPGPIRPFMKPMGVPDMPMLYFPPGAMPFVAPVHPPMFFPPPDPQLLVKIVNQIDYYFSNENLIKDTYLRRNMDQNGWVPVTLIAGFKKVMQLTESIQLILEAVRSSTVVEAQGDKIRRRDDWMRWIMPPTVAFPTTGSLQSPESPTAVTLSADIQNVSLNERERPTEVKPDVVMRSSSGNLSSSLPTSHQGAATTSGC